MMLPECTVAVGKQETMRLLAKNPVAVEKLAFRPKQPKLGG